MRIDLDGMRLLTDPVLRPRIGPLVRIAPVPREEDYARIDAVLLSHLHYDHADLASLQLITGSPLVLAPAGAGAWLRARGFSHVEELTRGTEAHVGPLAVVGTRALHDGRRRPFGITTDPIGFAISGSSSVYFAGDTDLFPEMAELVPSLDVALLPVSGWGPTLGAGHLDAPRAAIAAALLRPRLAVPIHWGTYAPWPRRFGPDDPARPARDFAELVAGHAEDVEVRVLQPGEETPMPVRSTAGAR